MALLRMRRSEGRGGDSSGVEEALAAKEQEQQQLGAAMVDLLVAHGADDLGEDDGFATGGFQGPLSLALGVMHRDDARIQSNVRVEAEASGASLEVRLDFGLLGETRRPVWIGCVGEGVRVRPHVAGKARIGMEVPGAAGFAGFLEEGELRESLFEKFVAGGNTRRDSTCLL